MVPVLPVFRMIWKHNQTNLISRPCLFSTFDLTRIAIPIEFLAYVCCSHVLNWLSKLPLSVSCRPWTGFIATAKYLRVATYMLLLRMDSTIRTPENSVYVRSWCVIHFDFSLDTSFSYTPALYSTGPTRLSKWRGTPHNRFHQISP